MGAEIKQALLEALEDRLFPALARWMAEAGVSVPEAVDCLRAASIREALKSIPTGIDPDSISLASVRTGLSRKSVREARAAMEERKSRQPGQGGHRGERVLAGWWHDIDYRDQSGQPRILSLTDGPHSFEALCHRYSGEQVYRTILKDLEQRGAVAVIEPGDRVQVLRQNYAALGWTAEGQDAMAEQLAEHMDTCLHNFKHPQGSQHLVCRRVANALVLGKHANILVRDLRDQVNHEADKIYDLLTDPQYTADPLDPEAQAISVNFYMTRKSKDSFPSTDPAPDPPSQSDAVSMVPSTTEPVMMGVVRQRKQQRRNKTRARK